MKKKLSFLLVCVMLLTTLSTFAGVSAETPNAVYLSDSGNDANDGLTKDTPVKTIAKAVSQLGGTSANGTIYVVEKYTYVNADGYRSPAAKHLTITGADDTAVFYAQRSNINLMSDVTFKNIKYMGTGVLAANGHTLIMSEDVETIPVDDSVASTDKTNYRKQFPVIYAGENSSGNCNSDGAVYLYAGTYNYLYATGAKTCKATTLFIGEKVTVMHNIHLCGSTSVINGDVNLILHGTFNGQFTFNKGGVFNGNLNVKFGKKAVWQTGLTGLVCKFNYYDTAANKSIDFSGAGACFAAGYTLNVEASRNQAASKISEGISVVEGFNLLPYIENAPVYAGAQIRENAETYDVRFAATVDSLAYDNIGFKVVANYGANETKEWNVNCTKVYNALTAIENGSEVLVTADEFEGTYIYALTVSGVLKSVGAVTFTVTPYAELDGSVINGNTYTVVCTPGDAGVAVA